MMDEKNPKIKTGIPGLDDLLFGGLHVSDSDPLVILIKGGPDTEKTLFGLQLIYRIGLFLNERPKFLSDYHSKSYLEDLLLDTVISASIREVIRMHVRNEACDDLHVADLFFETEPLFCCEDSQQFGVPHLKERLDELLAREIVHYSNRTNALHINTLEYPNSTRNLICRRRYEQINDYVNNHRNDVARINQHLNRQCGPIDIGSAPGRRLELLDQLQNTSLFAVELAPACKKGYTDWCPFLKRLETCLHGTQSKSEDEKSRVKIAILILDDNCEGQPDYLADLIIHLKCVNDDGYLLQQLRIEKCDWQRPSYGWHQYKRRDYGIEVYPSLHTYFQQRRYLERALIYTHSNVITDTFQQYLDYCRSHDYEQIRYEDYDSREMYREAMFPEDFLEYTSEEVFNMILLDDAGTAPGRGKRRSSDGRSSHEIRFGGGTGEVTGIIGDANTYKRFIAYGGMFSTTVRNEHALILMLHQETPVICRLLPCPACIRNQRRDRARCEQCLEHIHFMNFCIGRITPEEFIYYLRQQIEEPFQDGKRIRRIILDNLQIVDFCLPFLRRDPLFLPALMSLCRTNQISLYILCDKKGELVPALRALADNILCTERTDEGNLSLYVERFARYNLSPSRIYCGEIVSTRRLFECSEVYSRDGDKHLRYALNPDVIEEMPECTMTGYWQR